MTIGLVFVLMLQVFVSGKINITGQTTSTSASSTALSQFPSGWSSGTTAQTLDNMDSFPTDPNGCPFASTISDVIWSYSGAAQDPSNNRMILNGGGHNDGCDNSLYTWTLNANGTTSFGRIFGPSSPTNFNYTQGQPNAALTPPHTVPGSTVIPSTNHTYDGLVVGGGYFMMFPGYWLGAQTGISGDIFKYNLTTNTWFHPSPTTDPDSGNAFGKAASWDSNRNLVWIMNPLTGSGGEDFYSYDPATDTLTLRDTNNGFTNGFGYSNMVCDMHDQICLIIGFSTGFNYYDISTSSTYTLTSAGLSTSGANSCSALNTTSTNFSGDYVGLTYNSKLGKIVGYPGTGNSIYIINWSTRDCTKQTFTGTGCNPDNTALVQNALTGWVVGSHFMYFPNLDVYGCYEDETTTGKILNPN